MGEPTLDELKAAGRDFVGSRIDTGDIHRRPLLKKIDRLQAELEEVVQAIDFAAHNYCKCDPYAPIEDKECPWYYRRRGQKHDHRRSPNWLGNCLGQVVGSCCACLCGERSDV